MADMNKVCAILAAVARRDYNPEKASENDMLAHAVRKVVSERLGPQKKVDETAPLHEQASKKLSGLRQTHDEVTRRIEDLERQLQEARSQKGEVEEQISRSEDEAHQAEQRYEQANKELQATRKRTLEDLRDTMHAKGVETTDEGLEGLIQMVMEEENKDK